MKARPIAIVFLAAGLILAAGCSKHSSDKSAGAVAPPAVAVETATVTPSDVTESVEVDGTLTPKFSAEVKSEVTGRVAEVLVTEWAKVRMGDPLVVIDTAETQVVLRKAQAAVSASQAALETARASVATGLAGVEMARAAVSSAAAGLSEAKVAAERAEREYARAAKLKDAGLATQQSLDEALTQRDAARARVATVQSQVTAAEAQVKVAEAQVAVMEAQARTAEAQVAATREEVSQVEARLAKATVKSPFDGYVSERLVNVGEVVGDMQKVIFRLVDNRLLDLTLNVPSGEMGKVRSGQPVTFTVDAIPGRTFSGTISFINPAVNAGDRSVRVTARVPNEPEVLKGGLFARAFIVTGARTGVLRVPRSALVNWDTVRGTGDVFTVEGDTARRREVTIGVAEGDGAEITSGLPRGAAVVVRGGFNLRDGDRVKVTAGGGN